MAKLNPARFLREVRQEMHKVTWPSRRETGISTMMVLLLVSVTSVFFLMVDWVIGTLVRWILGIGG